MLNKYTRLTIIATIKCVIPVVLLLLLAPKLLHFNHEFEQVGKFFMLYKTGFVIAHSIFYLTLFWLWPRFIYFYIKRCNYKINQAQINLALNAKWYLLTSLMFFELLVWWR